MSHAVPLVERPPHVPPELVRDFNLYDIPGAAEDVQAAFAAVQRSAPDIFWTPHNGGHWVATRANDVVHMMIDYAHFSHAETILPPFPPGTVPPLVPMEVDPPRHADYRRPLMQLLTPTLVAELETYVREVAVSTIEKLVPRGECEFVQEFAKVLPIVVFFSLVKLPLEDKAYLVSVADATVRGKTPEARSAGFKKMAEYLGKWVKERRENPGEDLLSKVVTATIEGELIQESEATMSAMAVLFGGLDTVASMLGFIAMFLARNPAHRRELTERLDDKKFLKNAIEELIRRHGISSTGRIIPVDYDYNGIHFKKGDRILPGSVFAGMDDRWNTNPLVVDFNREKPLHAAFGNGPHACPGAILARREIRVFLEEWLPRIPNFSIKPGTRPVLAPGPVSGCLRLELVFS